MNFTDAEIITILITILIGIVSYLAKSMHCQAMEKLDSLIVSFNKMSDTIIRHDEKLEVGNEQFKLIAAHQIEQDKSIHQLESQQARIRERVHAIANDLAKIKK